MVPTEANTLWTRGDFAKVSRCPISSTTVCTTVMIWILIRRARLEQPKKYHKKALKTPSLFVARSTKWLDTCRRRPEPTVQQTADGQAARAWRPSVRVSSPTLCFQRARSLWSQIRNRQCYVVQPWEQSVEHGAPGTSGSVHMHCFALEHVFN